jgi:hypothetical protein
LTWAHNTVSDWNRLSPYDENMRTALPRYIQMLHQKLQARSMAGTDKIVWREFKEYLNASPQWFATQDIPTFLSLRSLPSRALSSKLSPKRKGPMRSNLPNVPRLLRSLRTLTKASASQTGELKSLPLSTVRRSPRRRTGVSIHSSD